MTRFLLASHGSRKEAGVSESRDESIQGLMILIAVFILLWIASWVGTVYFFENWQDRGTFGDMFGSVNALFSGAALAGVIYAILLQRRELQLQRYELELTREELKRTAEAQEESSQALGEQLKEMQDQTELQLRPFVVIKYTDIGSQRRFALANVGNSTAMNIRVYSETKQAYLAKDISVLEKSEIGRLGIVMNPDPADTEDFIITFQNMQNKDYHVKATIVQHICDITEFKQGKYDLPEPLNS